MDTVLLDGRKMIPTTLVRIVSVWGRGRLVYVTQDGFAGVQLDGESRVDEYPGEHVYVEKNSQ